MNYLPPRERQRREKRPRVSDEVFEAAQAGDYEAVMKIWNQYQRKIFVIINRIVKKESVAEEMTQDVFLKFFEKVGTIQSASSLNGWFNRVAQNAAISNKRLAANRLETYYEGWGDQDDDSGVPVEARIADREDSAFAVTGDDLLEKRQQHEQLQVAIKQLPDAHRTIVEMKYLQGMSQAEIADALDIPLGTAQSRIGNALEKLRRMMRIDEYISYVPGQRRREVLQLRLVEGISFDAIATRMEITRENAYNQYSKGIKILRPLMGKSLRSLKKEEMRRKEGITQLLEFIDLPEQREAVRLFDVEGKSLKEIAQLQRTKIRTVQTRIRLGREKMNRAKEKGISSAREELQEQQASEERRSRLIDSVADEKQRLLLKQVYEEGMIIKDIAKFHGTSPARIDQTLRMARISLDEAEALDRVPERVDLNEDVGFDVLLGYQDSYLSQDEREILWDALVLKKKAAHIARERGVSGRKMQNIVKRGKAKMKVIRARYFAGDYIHQDQAAAK